jgi:hypothetical protein
VDGDRITSINIINGFSEGSIDIGGFNVNEGSLNTNNISGSSVELNLELINFSVKKKHDGISPPLAHKFSVVDEVACQHLDSVMFTVTCKGRVSRQLFIIIIIIMIFIASSACHGFANPRRYVGMG